MTKVAIVGGTGYTGVEQLCLLGHPYATLFAKLRADQVVRELRPAIEGR